MRVAIRETGSIMVKAPRDRVLEVLRLELGHQPGFRATPDRVESRGSTYVLRELPEGGTRVIHARSQPATMGVFPKPQEDLRLAVQADLFQVQRLLDLDPAR